MSRVSHETLFRKFRDDTIINRCEQYGRWTLPALMADTCEVTTSGRVVVERDFQELGALLVNNLASKLVRLLFPTQYPFFKASASADFKAWARRKGLSDAALREAFAKLEMDSNERLFLNSGYASLILAMKHLIVTGQVLLYRNSKEGTITAWGIQNHSTRRDGTGKLLDCVLLENTTVEALPEDIQGMLRAHSISKYSRPEQLVKKYTRIHRVLRNGREGYEISQEVDQYPVGTPSWYPKDLCPFMVPTWTLIPGEHYGRGMVEEYAGGFARVSAFSESSGLYGVELLKVLHMVGAGSGTDVDDIAQAESGEWVRGDPQTVAAYEAGDYQKLTAIVAEISRTAMNLSKAFMYQANVRQAERVTAYELQRDAQEAEYALGGVYSSLSGGIQVPMAHILMTESNEMALTGIISGEIRPDVTAGIPALGRSSDVQNLLMAGQELAAIFPITQIDKRINPQLVVDMVLSGRSIDTSLLFYTPEQQKQNAEAERAQQAALLQATQASSLANASDTIQQTLQG